VDGLRSQLDREGVALVEDAAHAFPSRVERFGGRHAGTIGIAGAFSFYATKTLTTGEGGMLVTDDQSVADRSRLMALHGINASAWRRYSEQGSWYYEIEEAGYKYNMSDIMAALGLVQLDRAGELHEARRRIAELYEQRLTASTVADLIQLPSGTNDPAHALHLYVIRLALDRLKIDRAEVIERLSDLGVGTSVHFIPLHLHPYYRRVLGCDPGAFPNASREYPRVISLPIWPDMKNRDVDRVGSALEQVLGVARA